MSVSDDAPPPAKAEIAIVGLAGRFPGARSAEELWANLCAGRESIARFETAELEDCFDAETRRAPNFVRARSVLDDVDLFDPAFFAMQPREAALTDPQHRLFLECAWEALEDAGYDPTCYPGAIGVFAGSSLNTYFLNNVCPDRQALERFTSSYQVGCYPELLGAGQDFLATRVSYKLDLRGPSLTLQTACSTSLLAVAMACQSLLLRESDMALAGGVSISLPQRRGYLHQEGGMVSADGSCRPFDARATGTVFGSGAGVVLLKRLADARAAGDNIYGVVRGWGISNDGAGRAGFTAPSVDGQAAAIRAAQVLAGVESRSIGYVECHGTATPLGDPIEIAGLTQAFRAGTTDRQFCAIGSLKGNIGHLDAASGIAGLIKTVLALKHGQLPPTLHFETANPHIDFQSTPFYVQTRLEAWPRQAGPRRAGVSSFGVGGTNVHVVLEEAPAAPILAETTAGPGERQEAQLLPLSARSAAALSTMRARLARHLRDHPEQPLADIAHTLQLGRRAFAHRTFILGRSHGEAAAQLEGPSEPSALPGPVGDGAPGILFMFPGQGAQQVGMGADLYAREPVFRRHLDECAEILRSPLQEDLRSILYRSGDPAAAAERLQQTRFAQPAIFAVELALARLWMSWGVRPTALLGHSIGEITAAALAGVMSLEDALAFVAERGRLIQALAPGAMLALRRGAREIEAELPPALSLAASNGPSLSVLSGPVDAIEEFARVLEAGNIPARRLRTSHAFHSAMMDPIVEPLRQFLSGVSLAPPAIPIVSSVTGSWLGPEEATAPGYWAGHARAPVQFAAGLAQLDADSWPILLEVGPPAGLATLARQGAGAGRRLTLSSFPEAAWPETEREHLRHALGRLWTAGVAPDWTAQGAGRRRVPLPTYPFERSRHWIEAPKPAATEGAPKRPEVAAPMTSSALSAEERVPDAGTPAKAPDGLQARLAAIIEELSGRRPDRESFATSFLDLGFDSLFLGQLAQRIQAELRVKIAFRQLVRDHPSIVALAAFLADRLEVPGQAAPRHTGEEAVAPEPSPAVEVAESGMPRPSRFQPYRPAASSRSVDLTATQRRHILDLTARYTARTAGSKAIAARSRPVLADPRAVAGFRLEWKEMIYPIVCARARGSRLWDVDGNEYIDLVNGYGQTAFGHSPDFVIEALRRQLDKGFAIGPQAELAGEVASLVAEMTGQERVSFCNTGSEAVMAAMRVARAVTGRDKVVLFGGAYHGQFDEVLVKGVTRSDGTRHTVPVAPGIPMAAGRNIVVLDYASDSALEWLAANAGDLAAVVVEPVQSRHPDLRPIEFLRRLRRITEENGAAFVMDEVVTGFRVHPGGLQAVTGIRADLTAYGKVVGGGLPIGILAGRAAFMDALDGGMWSYGDESLPTASVTFFAGTFVRHPLALAATHAVLTHLKQADPALQQEVAQRTGTLAVALDALFRRKGLETKVESYSSFFHFDLFREHPLARLLFYHLRWRGIHIQDGFPCFLTTAHGEQDFEAILAAFRASLEELAGLGIFSRSRQAPDPDAPADPAVAVFPVTSRAIALTESQTEIWLAAQLGEDASCAFNESITVRLSGRLDEQALQRAVNEIVRRHESLRATFDSTGETMRIRELLPFGFARRDYSDMPDPEAALSALIARDACRPFDLVAGPMLRAYLIRLGPDRHAFIVTAHHIVCDGWSMNVILRELAALYEAERQGTVPALAPSFSFSRYAELRRGQQAQDPERLEAFWVAQFQHPVAPLQLPTDRPRPAVKSFHGTSRCLRIEADLMRALREAGAGQGATLFVMLLATFQLLLGRLAGQDEIVVGIPTAGQASVGQDILVGQCVNFLPLRACWTGATRFCDLLRGVRERVLDAYEHQDYTLATLVRKLALPRVPGRLPLVEVQFNLERLADRLALGELDIEVEPNPKARVNFDLFLNAIESSGGLRLDLDYNSDLWDGETIDRWLGYYRSLLQAVAEDLDQPVGRISYMPAAERTRLLGEINDTSRAFPRGLCLQALFEGRADRQPQATAAAFADQSMSYGELEAASNRFARYLGARLEVPRRLIAVCLERSLQLPVVLLGILKAGHAFLPLDPRHPLQRRRDILSEAGISALVTDGADGADIAPTGAAVIDLAAEAGAIGRAPKDRPEPSATAQDLAYVIFTSGSTGRPKGVEITHRAVVNLLSAMAREPGLEAGDILPAVTTVAFDIAILELFLPLAVGARVVIAPAEVAGDGFALRALLESSGATALQATPATWRILLEAGYRAPPGFKMLCGGEALARSLADELLRGGAALWNMYGPAETTVWSSCKRIEPGTEAIAIGRPIANTQLYILDREGQPVGIGVPGELHIGGEGVALGYRGRPDLTAEKFIANPFGPDRLYRTGDLVRWSPQDEIQFLGRLDDQVKLRGFRIEPAEIESALLRRAPLAGAAVALGEDSKLGPRLVAYFAERPGMPQSADSLAALLAEELPAYMVPGLWMRLDRLPLLPNGKLDRRGLPPPDRASPAHGARALPRTAKEIALARIWSEVLGREDIGINEDVLQLGADSIHLFQIAARAHRDGMRLTARQLMQHRTIEAICAELDRQADPAAEPVPRRAPSLRQFGRPRSRVPVAGLPEGGARS
jgi:amino acid adenylation domain-containing protein